MKPYFPASFFIGNRQKLRRLFTGKAPIVLTANGLLQGAGDEPFPFKQESNFWYLTGIDEPNIILVMDKAKEYLIVPNLAPVRVAFDGAIDPEVLQLISGVGEVVNEKEGWRRLGSRLKRVSNVAVLAPALPYIDFWGMYTNPARRRLIDQLKDYNPELTLLDLRQHLQRMRMVKQPLELAAIKKAIVITSKAITKVGRKFLKQTYTHEFEIEMDLTKFFWHGGSSGHAFQPVVASRDRTTTIHAVSSAEPIHYPGPLLLDIGATYQHYSSDIARTWTLQPTKRYLAIQQAVKEVGSFAASILKPGVLMRAYEQEIEKPLYTKSSPPMTFLEALAW